jgi:hypothetical protein
MTPSKKDEDHSCESRSEYSAVQKRRYRRAGKAYKTRRIDEVCEVCGYERKYAIKLLKIRPVRIDRLLKPCKAQLQRRRNAGTKPGTLLKNQD